MIYTVGEMAQKLGVPASTLRYYDKEGLLPFVERSSGGIRMFRGNRLRVAAGHPLRAVTCRDITKRRKRAYLRS